MRDVNYGWLIRYLHSNTASAFFFLVFSLMFASDFSLCVLFIIFIVNPLKRSLVNSLHCKLFFRDKRIGKPDNSPNTGNKRLYSSKLLNSLSDEDFSEWLRGFIDAEGNFLIQFVRNHFKLVFTLCLHKDELPLVKYIAERLGVGNISVREKIVVYTISSKDDLLKIFSILDKQPLNTSKNLNYIAFRQAYDLYFNRESIKVSSELHQEMTSLKNQMNKKRIDFNQPEGHFIKITSYWLLGFIEGDGYFSVNRQNYSLKFGIGQTSHEILVLEAIKKFILDLPGSYLIKRNNTNLVKLEIYNQAKGRDHKPMAFLAVNQKDFILNVLIPFFDNLIWLSKKGKDYEDWKLILDIINQGKHFTEEGKELIHLISLQMNNNRLSTNSGAFASHTVKEKSSSLILYKERALKLLSMPSNYEVQPDGKILIKSLGTYLKGRGNVSVKVYDDKGLLIYNFDSIQDCAMFFNVHSRTINRRLSNDSFIEFNGKKLVFKRGVSLS